MEDCKGGSIIKATEKLRPQLSLFFVEVVLSATW